MELIRAKGYGFGQQPLASSANNLLSSNFLQGGAKNYYEPGKEYGWNMEYGRKKSLVK
jgi:hypothetical protein